MTYHEKNRMARDQAYLKLYLEGNALLAYLKPTQYKFQILESSLSLYRSYFQIPYTHNLIQNFRLYLSRYLVFLDSKHKFSDLIEMDGIDVANEAFYALHSLYERALHSPLYIILMNLLPWKNIMMRNTP